MSGDVWTARRHIEDIAQRMAATHRVADVEAFAPELLDIELRLSIIDRALTVMREQAEKQP